MKKLLSCLLVMLVSISASAQVQFYQYKPYQPSRSGNSYGNNYGNNYGSDNLFNYSTPQRPQQQYSQIISTRGYYIKGNQWHSVLLRVKVIDEQVYVVGIKRSTTGWSNEPTRAYSTELMQKDIKENFDYYINDYINGRIYF